MQLLLILLKVLPISTSVLQYIFIRSSDWFWYFQELYFITQNNHVLKCNIFSIIWIELLFLYFILQDIFIDSFEISISETTDNFNS